MTFVPVGPVIKRSFSGGKEVICIVAAQALCCLESQCCSACHRLAIRYRPCRIRWSVCAVRPYHLISRRHRARQCPMLRLK